MHPRKLRCHVPRRPHRPIDLASITEKQLEIFHNRIYRLGDDCWPWLVNPRRKGWRPSPDYGVFPIGSKEKGTLLRVQTHRLAWQLEHPYQMLGTEDCVCHTCDWPPCCRTSHLWVGSNHANILDMVEKGRNRRGEATSNAKLDESKVRAILLSDERAVVLAARYDIDDSTIAKIKRRYLWRHVKVGGETGKGRGNHPQGEHHGSAKLVEEQVWAIRRSRDSMRTLAKRYNLNLRTVFDIIHRNHWRHVP